MICDFCQYDHDNEGDRYGCPNCLGGEVAVGSFGNEPTEVKVMEKLREIMAENSLTQREVAQLCMVSLKTVESWLAKPGAGNYRVMHDRHLQMLKLTLPAHLKQRKGK